MKKILAFVLIFTLAMCGAEVYASYEPMSYVNVGLDFAGSAVESFNSTVEQTTVIGYAENKSFTYLASVSGGNVFVSKGGGNYAMTSDAYGTFGDTLAKAKELRNAGVYAYGGYINGYFRVLVGLYGSSEEAAASASELTAKYGMNFEAVYLDMRAVMAEASYNCMVFRNDTKMFAFGGGDGGNASYKGKFYRGYIVADRVNSSNIAVVNLISMDEYLASVVGSEMYNTWPVEALKAQAVIARTYACTVTRYKNQGIDVTDDTYTQAYEGVGQESELTRRAAYETSGVVVLYNGALAQTFFTSSSGGVTADVYSAWGGGAGLDYLHSVADPYEDTDNIKSAVWQYSFTTEKIKEILSNSGVNIGDITNIYVADRGENDKRVRKLTFVGTDSEYSVTFDKCRTLLGLKSQYYYIKTPNSSFVSAMGADGNIEGISLNGAAVQSAGGKTQLWGSANVITASGTATVSTSSGGSEYVFSGRGYGHGIGLSQWGAKGMADAGFTYTQIIDHYYPGTNLNK